MIITMPWAKGPFQTPMTLCVTMSVSLFEDFILRWLVTLSPSSPFLLRSIISLYHLILYQPNSSSTFDFKLFTY